MQKNCCGKSTPCEKNKKNNCNNANSACFIIVLYILLAIILAGVIYY